MHKASPVELRTSIDGTKPCSNWSQVCANTSRNRRRISYVSRIPSQKLEMMVAKAEADERDQV